MGLDVRGTPTGMGLFDPDAPAGNGGPVTHPPEERERINAAAASARDAAAKKRAEGKAKKTAAAAQPAAKGNGATPPPDQDLSGDPEEGDKSLDPDSEPGDPLAPPEEDRTPAEKRKLLTQALLGVHTKESAKVGKDATKEVRTLCQKFGAKGVSAVPDDKVDEFWQAAQALCRKWGVPFVDEAPATDML